MANFALGLVCGGILGIITMCAAAIGGNKSEEERQQSRCKECKERVYPWR